MRPTTRRLSRNVTRNLTRRAFRTTVRVRWRTPNELAQSLTAIQRLLTCNRRLARLAPRFFDPMVVEREARERAERRRELVEINAALEKVYGPSSPSEKMADERSALPPVPGPRTQRVIERELANRQFWLEVARAARQRYLEHRPHHLPSWTLLARQLWLAVQLGRWAVGLETTQPVPDPETQLPAHDWEADLRRAYPGTP